MGERGNRRLTNQLAARRREFGGREGLLLHPVGESLEKFTPDYKSSPGQDRDGELLPKEVYNRFFENLMGKGVDFYPWLVDLLE